MNKKELNDEDKQILRNQAIMRRAEKMQDAFEKRQRANEVRDEDKEIVNRIRSCYTEDEIQRGVYVHKVATRNRDLDALFNEGDYENQLLNKISNKMSDELFDKGSYEGMRVDMNSIKSAIMDMDRRLEMLEEKTPYPYQDSFDA